MPAYAQKPATSGIWGGASTGKCFKSLDDFLIDAYGDGYQDDENVEVKPLLSPVKTYFLVLDKTPQINVTRILLEKMPDNETCVILYAPLASTLSLELTHEGFLPEEVISVGTPSPGFNVRKVIYRYFPSAGVYRPSQCFSLSMRGDERRISCEKLHE